MKKFRLHLVVDHPGLKWNVERYGRWPVVPRLGEIMYFAPDLEAKVVDVTHITNGKPEWRVFLRPWSVRVGDEGELEPVDSAEQRMGELVDNGEATLPGHWKGGWIRCGPRERATER